MLRKIILASHGSLAEGMYSAAEMIVGDCSDIEIYSLSQYKHPNIIYNLVKKKIEKHLDWEYVILCDINGGSVHNQLMQLMNRKNVYLVVGMTLSMVLELKLCKEQIDTKDLLKKIVKNSKDNTLIIDYESVTSRIELGLEDDCLW